jgi:hypothetical protein
MPAEPDQVIEVWYGELRLGGDVYFVIHAVPHEGEEARNVLLDAARRCLAGKHARIAGLSCFRVRPKQSNVV